MLTSKWLPLSYVLLFLLAGTPTVVSAQEPAAPTSVTVDDEQARSRFQIGVGGLVGFPFGTLGDLVGWTGGVGFEFAYRLARVPLLLGFEGQIQQYSSVFTADGNVGNGSLAGYLLVRTQGHRGRVRPYLDGVIGINHLCARCSDDESTPAIVSSSHLGVGAGGGVTMRWFSNPDNRDIFALDLRMRYMYTPAAGYLANNLSVVTASSHMLQGYVGLILF